MKVIYFLSCVCLFYSYADGDSAPFITACRAADSACLKSTAQKALPILARGVPALGIRSMDPMRVDRVVANQAGLQMDFKNTDVTGLRNCVVETLKRKDKKFYMDLKCSVTLVGDYILGGKLLILPIKGEGKYEIKIRDIIVKLVFQVEDKMVNGVNHWSVQNWKHTAEVKTNAHYQFDNLFNGNQQLSNTIHQFANTSWREIFQEVAPPIVKAIASTIMDEIQIFFSKVPQRELALD